MPSSWNLFVKENYHKVSHLPNKQRLKALSEMRKGAPEVKLSKGGALKAKRAPKGKIEMGGDLGDFGSKLVEQGFEKLKDAKEKLKKGAKDAVSKMTLADTVDFAKLFL